MRRYQVEERSDPGDGARRRGAVAARLGPEPAPEEIGGPRSRQRANVPASRPAPEEIRTARARQPQPAEDIQPPAVRRRTLLRMLASHDGLRRAIIAREVLGPPKGLRGPE